MTVDPTGNRNSRKAFGDIRKTHGVVQSALDGIWHWLNGVASGIANFFGKSVVDAFHTVLGAIETEIDWWQKAVGIYFKLYYWIQIHVLKYLFNLVMAKYNKAIAQLRQAVRYLERLIYVTTQYVLVLSLRAVKAETVAREKAIKAALAIAARDDRMLHQTIEREAASAYQVQRNERVSTIVRILEFAVTRNPELKTIIGDAITALLDLLAIDNPIARLALGFVIRDLIDKLGVDRLVGQMASDLLRPLLGAPKPRNLHGVILDMGQRLVAAESFEARFTEDGGSQVEQAGSLWRDITQPAIATSIVGFVALGVIDPNGWAKTLTNTVGRVGNDLVTGTADLIKGA